MVTVRTLALLFPLTALAAGCTDSSPQPNPTNPPPRVAVPTTRPAAAAHATRPDPVAAQFAPAAAPTALHVREVGPAVLELAARAEQGDAAYFAARMGEAGDHLVQLVMERVRASDLPRTYPAHLIGDRLNYHEKTHVQVELAQRGGKWVVSRLWLCR